MNPKEKRKKDLSALTGTTFDLLVIGGGASGAGCALDAAQRGMRVALIERGDWAEGTSSRSTKLLHGGVRYLEQAFLHLDFAQLRQVRHGLHERKTVIESAPHLAHQLTLVTPVFSWFEGLYLAIGLKIYGLIAGSANTMPSARWLKKSVTEQDYPFLPKRVHSVIQYYDGQFDDARYTLSLVMRAQSLGAIALNQLSFRAFGKFDDPTQPKIVVLEDRLSGLSHQLKARMVLNCAGPFSDAIRLAANPQAIERIKASKGVHITLPLPKGMDAALMIPKTSDGRVLFAIPFQDKLMVGTTDTPYKQIESEPLLEASEIDFLIETLNRYLAKPYKKEDVNAGFGGLRPLISAPGRTSTKQLLRDHEVEYDVTSGLVSLLGGKWTTYRLMAQDAINFIAQKLGGQFRPCATAQLKLAGAEGWSKESWRNLLAQYPITEATALHLHHAYGTLANEVLQYADRVSDGLKPILPNTPQLRVEVIWQAENEMAWTIGDVLARRWRMEFLDWQLAYQAAPEVGRLLAHVHAWSDAETEQAIVNYREQLQAHAQSAGKSLYKA